MGLPLIVTRKADVEQSFLRDLARDGAASMVAYVRAAEDPAGGFTVALSEPEESAPAPLVNTVISGQVSVGDRVNIDGIVSISAPHGDCISRVAIVLHEESLALLQYDVGPVSCERPVWPTQ
jgi:hypothetical protein